MSAEESFVANNFFEFFNEMFSFRTRPDNTHFPD